MEIFFIVFKSAKQKVEKKLSVETRKERKKTARQIKKIEKILETN